MDTIRLRCGATRLALIAVAILFVAANSHVAPGADPPKPPRLRWGGDREGGGPYIFSRDDDPTEIIGFEVELADAIANHMRRQATFVQCTWEEMLMVLSRGNIDVALNGYEFTNQRASRYLASLPYYIYELGLCAKVRDKNDPLDGAVKSWDDLKKPGPDGKPRRVGVLDASAADKYVTDRYGTTCHVVRFSGSVEILFQVNGGQLDATVQDMPILHFYVEHLKRFENIEVVDEPAAQGYYVAYVRANDEKLVTSINEALQALHKSGQLRALYERYGIWNNTQEKLTDVWSTWDTGLRKQQQDPVQALLAQIPLLIQAAGVTIALALISMPLAILIGVCAALVRTWDSPALGGGASPPSLLARLVRLPFTIYVELVRGTPLAFQLFVVYYILPKAGIRIDEFWSGVLALAVNYSAYEAEIFRLGLQAIPRGQIEAALSLGMSRFLAVRRIILPQAVRLVIPATANDFIALFKDTAVCSVIAVEELSKQYSMGAKDTGLFLEMAALASVLYLLMSYPLSLLAGLLERKLRGGVH